MIPSSITILLLPPRPAAPSLQFFAHILDFDLIVTGASKEEAYEKARLAARGYLAYGVANGWAAFLLNPAPEEFWTLLKPGTPLQVGQPLSTRGARGGAQIPIRVFVADLTDDITSKIQ